MRVESLHIFNVWMQSDWTITGDLVWQKAGWIGNGAGELVNVICRARCEQSMDG